MTYTATADRTAIFDPPSSKTMPIAGAKPPSLTSPAENA
eukprot:CAMPEP_0184310462 /NCGR_PEP_ID=MMETSP1049-20130417/30806_1 /TAXON_ID=77928 /ORGANISM="Proteomonas sulcata, Strain CCMP704" /LENGTH=38 /DNA_ID= /DNA_START= /DNA_END= /DNA_ORIENTATION=